MNAPQITKISILHLPFITPDSYEVLVNIKNFDKKKYRIIVQANLKNYELQGNTITIKIPTKPTNSSNPMAGLLPANNDLRIKAFVYDFINDKIVEAKLQEFAQRTAMPQLATSLMERAFETDNQTTIVNYEQNDELLSTVPVILGWEKPKVIEKNDIEIDVDAVDLNGYFYNIEGNFEGEVNVAGNKGNVSDVYTCKSKVIVKDTTGKDTITYKGVKLHKVKDVNITHSDFCYIAFVLMSEAGNDDIEELKCLAYTSFNRASKAKRTWKYILSTAYSSVSPKKELDDKINNEKSKLTRKALFYVLNGESDLTNGAEYWDGTDFLAWGNSETNPDNKVGSNKFDDYKFIEIPKDVYDSYLAANGSSTRYKDRGNHKTESDKGTHEHITKTVKKKSVDKDGKPIFKDGKQVYEDVQVPDRIKYSIPAAEFKNQDYWKSGSFYYETGQNKTVGISGVINKGKTIFWKETKKRLTSETPPK